MQEDSLDFDAHQVFAASTNTQEWQAHPSYPDIQ
jgi:hypothetical protein